MSYRRRVTKWSMVAALIALSALDHAGAFGRRDNDHSLYHNSEATVVNVIDGDTIDIDLPDGNNPVTRIRLWGIDCPEVAHQPGETDAHFGREAADFVDEHLTGRRVRIALEPKRKSRDRFGRLLAYVYLDDTGEMVNQLLVDEGLALVDTRFPHVFNHPFTEAERRAHRAKAGLWQNVTPSQLPPWRERTDSRGVGSAHLAEKEP